MPKTPSSKTKVNGFPRSERVKTRPRSIHTFWLQNRRIRMVKLQEKSLEKCRCFRGPKLLVHFAGNHSPSIRPNPKVTKGSRREAPPLPHDPKVPTGGRRERAAAAGRAPQSQRRQARSAEAAAGTRARNSHVPPHQPSGPNQQRPHRWPLAAASPQAGAGLSFQNTPQTSVAPCPRLRRSRTRRHTWSRTF